MQNDLGKKISLEQLECKRCYHKWWPRIDAKGKSVEPKNCPKCKSKYWRTSVFRKSVSESGKKRWLKKK